MWSSLKKTWTQWVGDSKTAGNRMNQKVCLATQCREGKAIEPAVKLAKEDNVNWELRIKEDNVNWELLFFYMGSEETCFHHCKHRTKPSKTTAKANKKCKMAQFFSHLESAAKGTPFQWVHRGCLAKYATNLGCRLVTPRDRNVVFSRPFFYCEKSAFCEAENKTQLLQLWFESIKIYLYNYIDKYNLYHVLCT